MSAGSKLGRYELVARIATGGMGEIFLARLEGAAGFEKLCVIKRILPHLADDARFRSMLIGEARIAANMAHANICHVYELDEVDRQLYMVMEHLEGVTLLQLLRAMSRRSEQLDLGLVAGIVQQAGEGLHYAHELRDRDGESLGVVHRDVTPSNLFLTESGVVKIVDFGVAKVKDASHTDAGAMKGKYAYMAPEQLRGDAIDRRVDVFSLGVVVYEMVSCRRLYQRQTDYLTLRAVMEPPVVDLREHRPDAPVALDDVLLRALARDPAERYATVRQLAAAAVEALGVRPWSQADISELIRAMFADDLRRHNAEIASVIRRSERGPARVIPVIVPPAPEADADYFSIETDIGKQPIPSAEFGPRSDAGSAAFGHALSVGAPTPQPLALPEAMRAAPRWHRVVPFAAILGGAAVVLSVGLALVGKPPPRRTAASGSAAGGSVAASPVEPEAAPAGRPRRRPSEPYGAAIQGHERDLDQCARRHAEPLPGTATARLVIGGDGRARRIALEPESVDASALGSCIREVLQTVAFPEAPGDKELALGLALRR